MKNSLCKLALVALLVVAGYLGWQNQRLRAETRELSDTVRLLEREKRELAQRPVAVPAVDRAGTLAEIEKNTSRLRGLEFKRPVTYKNIGREELKKFLKAKLAEQYTPQEMHDYSRSLETLGLIPAGTDLLEVIVGLYDEQVAAFYVPEERALYTFKDTTLAKNLDKVTMAHELTHALQDQNFDLTKFPLKVKDNDDLALATAALIEGDATVLMTEYYAAHLDTRNVLGDVLGGVMGQQTAKLQAAPPYFRDMMLFPYQHGAEFAGALAAVNGPATLNAAFQRPPVSTREILHPEKYLKDRREPVKVELPKVEKPGWRLVGDNVLGEFGLRSLFSQYLDVYEAQRAAAGWLADRYHVYERGTTGPCVLDWQSEWETESDAKEFVATYDRVAQKRGVVVAVAVDGKRVSIRQAGDKSTLAEWTNRE